VTAKVAPRYCGPIFSAFFIAVVFVTTVFAVENASVRPSLYAPYSLELCSEGFASTSTGVAFFMFARSDRPRMRMLVEDGQSNLGAFSIECNAKILGMADGSGWVEPGTRGSGFEPDTCSDWLELRGARRGLNRVVLRPIYLPPQRLGARRQRVSWRVELYLQKANKVEPSVLFRGLRELVAVEEELYYHLRRFDQLLRDLPERLFPPAFVRSSRILPRRMARVLRLAKSKPYVKMAKELYYRAYGRDPDLDRLMQLSTAQLEQSSWVWDMPGKKPLAAYLYSSNRLSRTLHTYLSDVVLAKRATKNAYLEWCSEELSMSDQQVGALLRALSEERKRLSDLVEAIVLVRASCSQGADRVYAQFPTWRNAFRRAFCARVRARIWPGRMYPRQEDLFEERVLLDEYFRLIKSIARADLQRARFRYDLVEAFVAFPAHRVVVPGLSPLHPQDNP